jgi:hypothetical protein
MDWTVERRHELILVLERELVGAARMGALCRRAAIDGGPAQGAEGGFAFLSRVVIAAGREGRMDELVEAARGMVSEEAGASLDELMVDPAAETVWSEPETVRAEPSAFAFDTRATDETILDDDPAGVSASDATVQDDEEPRVAPTEGLPRPAGTPAQAPPLDGASSYLVRRVHLGVPSQVAAGEAFDLQVTLAEAAPGSVPAAPAEAPPWTGDPVTVELELWLEEGYPADGAALQATLQVGAADPKTESIHRIVAAEPLSDGVDITVRFFVAGYEVGRGRTFVVNRDSSDAEPRPGAPGGLVIPDTILG